MSLSKQKSELRKNMLAKRAAIHKDERQKANQKIFAKVTALPEYEEAKTVFIFVSVSDEPDTRALIEDAWKQGKRVCVPRCTSMGVMQAYAIESFEDLQEGAYDIPEPKKHCQLVPTEEVDLIVVPCVCSNRDGYRLGYGGGFYDRWLETSVATTAMLCFSEMLVPEVPLEPHDQQVDILVSDALDAVLRFEK